MDKRNLNQIKVKIIHTIEDRRNSSIQTVSEKPGRKKLDNGMFIPRGKNEV